jgi:hypothetical protein
MRAFSAHGAALQLGLADVEASLRGAVEELGFDRRGAVYVRTFRGEAPHAATAAARFELCAEAMVRQTARLDPAPWRAALAMLLERASGLEWWLAGSAALAVRGLAVEPRDLDVIATADAADALAEALADVLVEPPDDGGLLGERWFRAFGAARIECVGGVHASLEPCDFGVEAGSRREEIEWEGAVIRVPPLALQLAATEARGLHERAALIREALP